ncbi:hypothetical protein D0Z07_0841 [Hyphodiscus hymeniophilus]|uniref:Glycosyl hydrolase n=1 Tax=Hyphodiscus hymeniophilus TaxID=353542 RepID=A0A9P6VPH4_9HELO|nr:hypothetical protein D0Z07_0841 [Hyphodiscus hymeniophilus]
MFPNRRPQMILLFAYIFNLIGFARGSPAAQEQQSLGDGQMFNDQKPLLPSNSFTNRTHALPAFVNALDVLQSSYFEVWQGNWPNGIDWTKAVIGTYLSSALLTISTSFDALSSQKDSENLVNKYFSHLIAAYFGQDAFALRQQAYDDMLWVVLGWLESVKFINEHSTNHYSSSSSPGGDWYAQDYIPAFAHRARIFWELASQGWDTSLCSGGMIWNPYLVPYKNAITNELYISASISMYLYFPGDKNTSPFGFAGPTELAGVDAPPGRSHDPKYLAAAIEAYRWLNNSNMTDAKGLYVDGYHISGWSREQPQNRSHNTRCDARNEMVYTYNQGVLLSGQRGLYEATGARSYLEDGHKLVADVISATGWDLKHNKAPPRTNTPAKWQGLGRSGVLEEACDAPGFCSQDSQTFKGIFFHHLTIFCSVLPDHLVLPDGIFVGKELADDSKLHVKLCNRYGRWIRHNAEAAMATKDAEGRFGMWWGAPSRSGENDFDSEAELPDHAVDYRNTGVPQKWKNSEKSVPRVVDEEVREQDRKVGARDLNDRGRGRTVETQSGGVAVLRALWELTDTR